MNDGNDNKYSTGTTNTYRAYGKGEKAWKINMYEARAKISSDTLTRARSTDVACSTSTPSRTGGILEGAPGKEESISCKALFNRIESVNSFFSYDFFCFVVKVARRRGGGGTAVSMSVWSHHTDGSSKLERGKFSLLFHPAFCVHGQIVYKQIVRVNRLSSGCLEVDADMVISILKRF